MCEELVNSICHTEQLSSCKGSSRRFTAHKNLKIKINKFTSFSLCNCLDNPQTVSSKVTVLKPRHVSNPNKNLIVTFIASKATASFSRQNNAMLVKLRSLLASQMIRKRVGISSGHSWEFTCTWLDGSHVEHVQSHISFWCRCPAFRF